MVPLAAAFSACRVMAGETVASRDGAGTADCEGGAGGAGGRWQVAGDG